jgi:hypothetical protein
MRKNKHLRLAIVLLLPLLFVFSQCIQGHKQSTDARGAAYAGAATCVKCHKDVAQNYFHSAHFLTSRTAAPGTVSGSFNPDSNTVVFNDSVKVVMEKHADGLYQASYTHGKLTQQHRFDITLGANRGETYFYWKGNKAYQLPVSYYISLNKWANSPAYSADSVDFSRVIGRRCFECHSSYIKNLPGDVGAADTTVLMDKKTLVMGIDCERCHGPGTDHVNFHTEHPAEKKPMYITRISALARSQRIDLCSVCHGGNGNIMTRSTFDFKPGDTLSNFNNGEPFHAYKPINQVDVHGNQVKLLTNSKCFMSSKIECATCHNMHDNEVKTLQSYSQYCTGCHNEANHNFCKMAPQIGPAIKNNCIDCHMPIKTSHAIVINGEGKQMSPPFLARTHLIAIYPEDSQKILAWMKGKKS